MPNHATNDCLKVPKIDMTIMEGLVEHHELCYLLELIGPIKDIR